MLVAVLCVCVAACASSPTTEDPDRPPPDFALVLTVAERGARAERPAALRPAQYVLTADGVLRAAVGPGATHDLLPAPTARLTPAQRRQLWPLVVAAGLDRPDASLEPEEEAQDTPLNTSSPPHDARLTTALTGYGRTTRQSFTLAERPAAGPLLDALAGLRGDPAAAPATPVEPPPNPY